MGSPEIRGDSNGVNHQCLFSYVLCGILAITGSACNGSNYPSGHYEGSLYQRSDSLISERPVSIDISDPDRDQGTIIVNDPRSHEVITLDVTRIRRDGFNLNLPAPWGHSVRLTDDTDCFVHSEKPKVSFCKTDTKIFLQVLDENSQSSFTLSGDKFGIDARFTMETPKAFTLTEAIQTALKKNFQSRIEFEHLIQARETARAAYLNLLPHLGVSTVLGNLTSTVTSLLGSIGDLAPFLLSNRWLQAVAQGSLALAESDGLNLMQADLAATVEGLSYALIRDEESLMLYEPLLKRLTTTLPQVVDLEKKRQMLPGSALHLRAIIDWLKLDVISLDLLVKQDKEILSSSLGFHNPEAITDVSLGDEFPSIGEAKPQNADELVPIALGRAFELRQVDHLVAAANDATKEIYFSWLDPSGDPTMELGPSMGANIAVAKSKINELLIIREDLQSKVTTKVTQAVSEWNEALDSLPLMEETLNLQAQRLEFVLSEIGSISLNTLDIEGVVQDTIATGIRHANLVAEFRVARSKIDRLMLTGHYLDVQPHGPTHSEGDL